MAMRGEEFEEDDIWSHGKEIPEDSGRTHMRRRFKDCYYSSPKMIPRTKANPSTSQEEGMVVRQSSAPMNIPDWSKVYGKSNRDGHHVGYHHGHTHYACDDGGGGGGAGGGGGGGGDDDEDDDEAEMVPPHEWLAKKLARSQISSFSMCEGIGRTLKGRDLTKVRNAVLTKTGFLE